MPDGIMMELRQKTVQMLEAIDSDTGAERTALDELATAVRTFTTAASYNVEVSVEDDLMAALENAERLLA